MIDSIPLWLPVAFLLVAFVYAAAGFGGGSAYLAVLAMTAIPFQALPEIALVCNVVVTLGGVWHFYRGGHLSVKRVLPFFVLSIPMAFIGGQIELGQQAFYVLLGGALVAAGVWMLIPRRGGAVRPLSSRQEWAFGLVLGAVLGLLSGMTGIGGGVYLAPLLLLTGWTTPKQTAATAALFIMVNSAAGLAGHLVKSVHIGWTIVPLAAAALIGGQIGSRLGSYRLSGVAVQRLLAAIIIVVGVRSLWKAI